MPDIDFSAYDLGSPLERGALLLKIPPDREIVRKYHPELLDLFRREMAYRRGDSAQNEDESECFEQLYWCALLLYLIGSPADAALMWEGKQINMDTACGFDVQFLVGAGVDETTQYLETHGQKEPAEYLKSMKDHGEFDNLSQWEQFRVHYFYPTNPLP